VSSFLEGINNSYLYPTFVANSIIA
jgi:hypothetical protein